MPSSELAQQTFASLQEGLSAWLRGLELVRARFVALLTAEGIQAIDALHQPFDPHLHVAVESEARNDVVSNTVVRVMRKGYRQQQRILRYVEEDASPVLEFDAGTLALLDRARQALENPKLDPAVATDRHTVIDQITDAAEAGDEEALQDACDELIDLLIAAEE